jgi:DNA-directed RNA polymerase specialized sigma24 family protein
VDRKVRALVRAGRIFEAWSCLHDRYDTRVRRFVAHRRIESEVDAVCRDIWNDVYRSLVVREAETSIPGWLVSIARHRLGLVTTSASAVAVALVNAATTGRAPPHESDLTVVAAWLSTQPSSTLDALALRYRCGLESDEIAAMLEVSSDVVEDRISSAVAELRELVGDQRSSRRHAPVSSSRGVRAVTSAKPRAHPRL